MFLPFSDLQNPGNLQFFLICVSVCQKTDHLVNKISWMNPQQNQNAIDATGVNSQNSDNQNREKEK